MQIFYNSSLPRAGSTIFQNVIGQRPDFYATPTSGLLELIFAARNNYSSLPEFKAQDAELMKKAFLGFCREGMQGYFKSITDKPYVVDKSRGWGIHHGLLTAINGEDPKIICMVRDLRDILSSMEKNYRKNPHKYDSIINHGKMIGTTTRKRVDYWLCNPPVGLALERIAQMITEGIDKKIHFIKFEDLCLKPKETMDRIYEYLGVPSFDHDFDNVEQITKEDDEVYGISDLHTIRKKVEPVKQDHLQILGNDVSSQIYNSYKWYFDYFKYASW